MTIDCTLDSLKIPALPVYSNEFGTKKQNGGLTTAECADDAMLPFRKMRPYEINEDSETTEIQHNAVFVVKAGGVTLTLHDCSDDFLGCEARVINVSSGSITVKGGVSGIDGGTAGVSVPAKREIRLIFLSDGWHSSYNDFCNVTEKEIAASAVTTAKIKDKSVTNAKIGETLTIANGGTGATTANQSINNLAAGLTEATGDGSDAMGFITTDASSINIDASSFKIYKRSGLKIWNWIKSKIKAVLGLDETSLKTATITASGTVTAKAFSGTLSGNSSTATAVLDYGNTSKVIKIGYVGSGLESTSYLAAYNSDGSAVKNIAPSKVSVGYASSAGAVNWNNITGKPSSYTPSSHTHTKSQITDFPASMPASDVYDWAKAKTKPSYAWSEITGKPSSYTPSSHTHTKSQITDFPASMPASDVYDWAKAKTKPSYAWSEITGKPAYITGSYSNGVLNLYTN